MAKVRSNQNTRINGNGASNGDESRIKLEKKVKSLQGTAANSSVNSFNTWVDLEPCPSNSGWVLFGPMLL